MSDPVVCKQHYAHLRGVTYPRPGSPELTITTSPSWYEKPRSTRRVAAIDKFRGRIEVKGRTAMDAAGIIEKEEA